MNGDTVGSGGLYYCISEVRLGDMAYLKESQISTQKNLIYDLNKFPPYLKSISICSKLKKQFVSSRH